MKETSQLTCSTNQWTGFYVITASVMKGLSTALQVKSSRMKFLQAT